MAHVVHSKFWIKNDISYNSGGLYLFRDKQIACLDWKWSDKVVELGGVAANKLSIRNYPTFKQLKANILYY